MDMSFLGVLYFLVSTILYVGLVIYFFFLLRQIRTLLAHQEQVLMQTHHVLSKVQQDIFLIRSHHIANQEEQEKSL